MPPKKVVQAISSFEKDPLSKERREKAPDLTEAEIHRRNEKYNDALYSNLGSSFSSKDVNNISENPEAEIEELADDGHLENFHTKIANETEDIYQSVLSRLSAEGMPEAAINDSSRINIRKRVLAEVDRIAVSKQESLNDDTVGGRILSDEARNKVENAVVGEELIKFRYDSPGEALGSFSVETLREMDAHAPDEAPELRGNEDLSLLGGALENSSGANSVQGEVKEIITEQVELGSEINDAPEVDEARQEVLDLFEQNGGDLDGVKAEVHQEVGDDTKESAEQLDREMISANTSEQASAALNQTQVR